MNDETRSTVGILNRIAFRQGKGSNYSYKWLVISGSNVMDIMDIVRDGDQFYMASRSSVPTKRHSGFEFLEWLARFPLIAARLAEPFDG